MFMKNGSNSTLKDDTTTLIVGERTKKNMAEVFVGSQNQFGAELKVSKKTHVFH